MTEQEAQDKLAFVKGEVSRLMEHFDTVRIFVTKFDPEDDQTLGLTWGGGNVYAQERQAQEWLKERNALDEEIK